MLTINQNLILLEENKRRAEQKHMKVFIVVKSETKPIIASQ